MRAIIFIICIPLTIFGQYRYELDQDYILDRINELRAEGCYCGRTYMEPVGKLSWNDTLYESAYGHAREMARYRYFSHISKDGLNVGERAEAYGYDWKVIGENIGEGQGNFDQVFREWKNSKSHCKMMMDPRVDEVAVARVRYKWVQHFGIRRKK